MREPSDTGPSGRSRPTGVSRPSLTCLPVAEFLSAAWIAELDAAARAATDFAIDGSLIVEQVVRDAGGAAVRYQVGVGPLGATVTAGAPEPADLILVTDHVTARALHEGGLRAQDALASGALKVRGRPEVLAGRADLLARLDHAFAPVRARTTFAPDR